MRRALPHVIALLLGAGSALLVACGGGATKGGIPAASAGELKSQLASLQQVVADRHCDQIATQLKEVDSAIDGLPGTVDERLRKSLRDASDLLRTTALDECDKTTQTTATQPARTHTQTQTTATQTTPTQTQTEPPATTTQPVPTTTTPPVTTQPTQTATNPVPPGPVQPPVPPPAEPAPGSGGGATPGIQP